MYNVLQFLHVAAAMVWIGSGVALVALFATMTRAGDQATVMSVSGHLEKLGPRLFGPAAMGTLLFGILTVLADDALSFTDLWIIIGLVGVALSMVIVVINNGIAKKMAAAIQAHGPQHPEVAAAMSRTRALNLADLVLLFIVVWAMVTKPLL